MGTSYDVVPLVSSGSGAMEASVTNLFSPGDKVIVCSAGKFGERWVDITKSFGLNAVVLSKEYGDVVRPAEVAGALAANPDARGVFVQATDTSTGAAHDIEAMAKIIGRTDALFVIDAITGLGTMPLKIEEWGLDVVIGGSQKAFMIPPGLAFLSISPKAWKRAESAKLPKFYFNLKKEAKNVVTGEVSWTPATSIILALAESLKYIKSLGMDKLIANAQLLARATRGAAKALDLEVFSHSPGSAVTAIKAPAGIDSGKIVKGFRERFGMIIANGQGSMKGHIFRIAHLGYFDFADMFAVIGALELVLIENGHPLKLGAGVTALQEVYAEVAGVRQPVSV